MSKMKIGIIREGKVPHDQRVPFTPEQCLMIVREFPNVVIVVQPSAWRCFKDEEYVSAGISMQEDISDCDILMGIKEVPKKDLIPGKKYLFFSHTIKKQPHNRELLRSILEKKITLIDYECLVDAHDNRIIGFGRFAGIVGGYNGLMAYGLKYHLFDLKPAHLCHDKKELFQQLDTAHLPNIKIVVTGGGRVANGACETMGAMNIRKVTPYEFLNYSFREAVYVQLHSEDYYEAKDRSPFSAYDFHHHPANYRCIFSDPNSFASMSDMLIHCTYWDPKADVLFTKSQMRDPDFRISVIADVTCDLNGSIPSTTQVSTIEDKFYGYDTMNEKVVEPFAKGAITVMAIDHLPDELPRDASDGFGKHLFERVLPSLFGEDKNEVIKRASITQNGELTERFGYLKDYVA
jgi:saccharopine dehydrogenase (NAD+, L-lysine-forming)